MPALVSALAAFSGEDALAQGQSPAIPGLIVTIPPAASAPPAAAPPPTARPKANAPVVKAKPKPKPRPRREASAAPGGEGAGGGRSQGIVVLVNDEPITAFEVEQRTTLMALGANIGQRVQENFKRLAQAPSTNERLKAILQETIRANQGRTREQILAAFEARKKAFVIGLQQQAVSSARSSVLPGLKAKALDELIEERLKLQEGKRLNIVVPQEEVDRQFASIAERNKMTLPQFMAQLKSQGIDGEGMKTRMRVGLVWRDVIRKRFGHQISVTGREVDRLIESSATTGEAQVELQLHRITLSIPGRIDQRAMAARLAEAESLRRKFRGCKSTPQLAAGVKDAKFENLGNTSSSTLSEPTRSLLLNAKDGEMVPPSLGASGVELYAVCGRKTVKVDEQKRQRAQEELTMREFEILARRHLRDLRTDALIERR